MRPSAIILNYHNIVPAGTSTVDDPNSISLDKLVEHIDLLEQNGVTNIPLQAAFDQIVADPLPKQGPLTEQYYAITFDDGYESLFHFLPGLIARIRPALFLLTEYTGNANLMWNTHAPVTLRHLSLEQIHTLAEHCDLEFHGTDHHNLLKFEEAELHRRFEAGMVWFDKYLGRKPAFIAYPYGYCNQHIETVASHYFKGGFTVSHGKWYGAASRFSLNRLSVKGYLTGQDIIEIIRGDLTQRWFAIENRAPWRRGEVTS